MAATQILYDVTMEGRWPPCTAYRLYCIPPTQCRVFPPYFCGDKTPRDVMALADSNFGKFRPRWAVWAKTIGTFEKRRRATVDLLSTGSPDTRIWTGASGRAVALGIPPVFLCSANVSNVDISVWYDTVHIVGVLNRPTRPTLIFISH